MFQFSLRNLLIAVAAVAVGTAALLNANSWWASLLWGAALLLSMFAGFVAFFRREAQRAFWGGYVVAGGLYLLLLMYSVPQLSSANTRMPIAALNYSNLVTTKVIVWAYSLLPTSKTTPALATPPGGSGGLRQVSLAMLNGQSAPSGQTVPNGVVAFGFGPAAGGPPNPGYIDPEVFGQVGHALWMFFLSWLGGTMAFLLFRSRERPSPSPVTPLP